MRLPAHFHGTAVLLACAASQPVSAPAGLASPERPDPVAAVAQAERLASRELWPGWDPRDTPVAIFDGERTLLFRHPSPPPEFQPDADHPGVWSRSGRHAAVTSNSSAEIGGVRTATVLAETAASSLGLASTILHESFHVHQHKRHPQWLANEVDLFTFPVDDPDLLALRRQETEALRRALAAKDQRATACWAQVALRNRGARFNLMGSSSATYERLNELNEGLATYIEHLALDLPDSLALPAGEYAPEAVRDRSYASGTALALLLDRARPGWKREISESDTLVLDALLTSSAQIAEAPLTACGFAPDEVDAIEARAGRDVDALHARRAARRSAFLAAPGWQLTILPQGSPLFPQEFDPLNVHQVAPGEVLHSRFVTLARPGSSIEILDRAAITKAAGAHPLFNGVLAVIVTGLPDEPRLSEREDVLIVAADGVRAELRNASVDRSGTAITIRLRPAQ